MSLVGWYQLELYYSNKYSDLKHRITSCIYEQQLRNLYDEIINHNDMDRKAKKVFLKFLREKEEQAKHGGSKGLAIIEMRKHCE